jgi:predicted DNA-binding protein (UPF0251 family)
MLAEIVLGLDELEALRLADLEGLGQEEAGKRMGVSRATFGRIVESARKKTAQALVQGAALRVEGGAVTMAGSREFACGQCGRVWHEPLGTGRPSACPQCGSENIGRQGPAQSPGGAASCPPGGGRGRGGRRGGGGRGRGCGRGGPM